MPTFKQRIRVEMEDGTSYEVTYDQRDLAKWEAQPFYLAHATHTMVRFMAFAATARTGEPKAIAGLSWPAFNASCIEAGDPYEDAPELDPTQPDPSGDS